MPKNALPFSSRQNFKNECFYYYLPYYIKRSEISEKISKFQGVIIYFKLL
jgi:hypothetical protein